MTASWQRWVWILAWACALGCVVSFVLLGRVAADDDYDDGDDNGSPVSVVITESEGDTRAAEGGPGDSYTIVLAEAPTATVEVALSTDGQVRVEPVAVTFTAANWDLPESIAVTAVDDNEAEGAHSGVVTHSVTSLDPRYDGLSVADVAVAITDDDVAGVSLDPTSLAVTEGGPAGSYTIRLTSQPSGAVAIAVSVEGTELQATPDQLTFGGVNWDMWQTVAVAVVDDDVATGPRDVTIRHSAQSVDAAYHRIAILDVAVAIADDDAAGVSIAPTTVQVEEGGATDTYEVTLESRPQADVTIRVTTDGQTRTNRTAVTFSPAGWDLSQQVTVTAEDDGVEEGPHQSTISHGVESADATYDGIAAPSVTVAITDRVIPAGVRITESGGNTRVAEGGSGDSYIVELASRPKADATIHLTTDEQVTVAPAQLTFTAKDWSGARSVAVSAVDDRRAEGQHAGTIRHTCTSADPVYNGIGIRDVVATVADDDTARVSVSPPEIDMVEGDDGVGYALALESEPAPAVVVRISTDGLTTVRPTEVRFTPDDWQEPRWVSVAAADDATQQGTRVSEVRHSVESDDALYGALAVDPVSVTVRDNERADVIVSSSVTEITARDGSTSFVVRLASRPTADVVIPLYASSERVRLSLSAVRLTRDTWQAGVQVIVSANVDASWYGEETCTIALGPISSGDPNYDGRDPEDVAVALRIERTIHTLIIPLSLRAWPPMPAVPALQPVDNPEGRGDYTVVWGAAERADGYLLQEAADLAFAGVRELYAGPDVSHAVSGHGPGRYYYRVAATNAWGVSAWSGVVAVDVRWEREPNDDALTQANGPLVADVTYHGTLTSGGDVQDYYLLEVGNAGRIEVWLEAIPADQNYDLVVRDASLTLVGYSAELGNAGEHILTGSLPAGTYYIQVYQRSGGGSGEPYALRYVVR